MYCKLIVYINSDFVSSKTPSTSNPFAMILQKKLLAGCLLGLALTFSSCEKIDPCGTFTFTGEASDGDDLNGLDMDISFAFDPELCASDCSADKICYIQIVRTYNFDDGTYSYISEEHEARAIDYGWYVDRLSGKAWGYYGRNDDGTFAGTLTPGDNDSPAILVDFPKRNDDTREIWWQAVSAPVSIDGGENSCNNNFLGYYFWSWFVDEDGVVTNDHVIDGVAWENLHTTVDDAVAAWNTQAPDLDHNLFPAFDKLMY